MVASRRFGIERSGAPARDVEAARYRAVNHDSASLLGLAALMQRGTRVQSNHTQWTKSDLINWLATQREYRSYLEMCSITTGLRYGEIDRAYFAVCHRLMYRCPRDYADGLPIDFRSVGLDISDCVRLIRERGYRYDLILVDPWHEYGASMRDLTEALSLLTDRGTIVVHDCLPPTAELALPNFIAGAWCGVTYQAYLDFVFARANLEYRTVDIDYGCGVIRERSGLARVCGWWRTSRKRKALIAQWHALGDDSDKTLSFLQNNKTLLCNLRSLDDFIAEEGCAPSH